MTAYASLANLKAVLGIGAADTSQDTALNIVLEQSARYLDAECERDFLRHPTSGSDPDETRIVRASGRSRRLMVRAGVISLTSVDRGDSPTGPWTAVDAADYALEPWDLPPGETHESLLLVTGAGVGSLWPAGYYRLIGDFGFAAVPPMIVDANLDGARELQRQGPGGGGPIGVNQFGTPMFLRGVPKSVIDAIRRYAWRHRDFSSI